MAVLLLLLLALLLFWVSTALQAQSFSQCAPLVSSSSVSSFAGIEQLASDRYTQYVCACVCVQVVFRHPHFISYFRNVTPEEELGGLNIGSRPARYAMQSSRRPLIFISSIIIMIIILLLLLLLHPEYATVAAVDASCELPCARLHTGLTVPCHAVCLCATSVCLPTRDK